MRFALGFAVMVGAVAVVAVLTPSVGSSETAAKQPKQDCGRVEYTSGLELVFKRFSTHAPAVAYRNRIAINGFLNGNIIQGCDSFRVVIRGMESFDVAVELQSEAKTAKYATTIECIKGKDDVSELEVVFGHRRNRVEAEQLVLRAADSGFTGLKLEPDPCGGFEIMIKGFKDRPQAQDFVAEAKQHGFDVVIENS